MLNQNILFSENLDGLLARFCNENDCSLIIYCKEGRLQIEIDGQLQLIATHDLLLCQPELLIGNYMRSPDFKCTAIAIRKHALDDVLYMCVREDNKWWEKSKYLLQNPIIHLNGQQQELAQLFNRLFLLCMEDNRSELSENIRRIFAQAAIYELLNWLEESVVQTPEEEHIRGRKDILFREFVRLLHEAKGRQREVRWFAGRLNVSPKYLSVVCHANTGKTAQEFITEIATREIKRLLRQTDMSIKEICGQMNFPSLSFFCKYTRQHLGMTARQYRTSIS